MVSVTVAVMLTPMQPMRNLGGRPSKGRRKDYRARIPEHVAVVVEAEAHAREMPYTDYIAVLVSQALGFDVLMPERKHPLPEQTTLDISA